MIYCNWDERLEKQLAPHSHQPAAGDLLLGHSPAELAGRDFDDVRFEADRKEHELQLGADYFSERIGYFCNKMSGILWYSSIRMVQFKVKTVKFKNV